MVDPVVKTIEVPCDRETAFRIFVENTSTWWPLDKNTVSAMDGNTAKSVTIEPSQGGRIYEIGHDEKEHDWGTVITYDPFAQLTLAWHINAPASEATTVEVTFAETENNKTTVQLTHHNWDSLGERAASMREGYNSGWVGVFEEAFAKACNR